LLRITIVSDVPAVAVACGFPTRTFVKLAVVHIVRFFVVVVDLDGHFVCEWVDVVTTLDVVAMVASRALTSIAWLCLLCFAVALRFGIQACRR
jgi:hypothetical protein